MNVTERTITVGRHRIHLKEAGTGPMVLLLHGWPETSYSWRHQMTALADAGYHAVAYDGLGYGRSAKPPLISDYRITELVAVAAGVVDVLGEKQAHVVGHDWGAIVAWTAAWTRPDVFRSVVGLSVPFGGRGQFAFPGSPFGEMRPSEIERIIAGPDNVVYKEYFNVVGRSEQEFDHDTRQYLRGVLSAGAPEVDATKLSRQEIVDLLPSLGVVFPKGVGFGDLLAGASGLPAWLSEDEFETIVAEFERTGLAGGFNWYRNTDLNWELLAPYEGRPVEVPALYVGAEFDAPSIWGQEAISQMEHHVPDLRGKLIIKGSAHYIQSEAKDEFNRALLAFLAEVSS